MNARDLMSRDPVAVTPGDPLLRAAVAMRDLEVGMVPVVGSREEMRPVGVITDRDIVVRHVAAGHLTSCTCAQVMSRGPLVAVAPDTPLAEVMHRMARHRVRRVLVVDAGRLVGVVSAADILSREQRLAPELVEAVLQQIAEPELAGV
ncbi:CBS domain-containing protein [Longimicrobium sp.]|uniref:CBS domain-containing protein n=1 Tax=Longimicrobium sp. TaxID=2029185 RepID=UPI002CD69722|nr:CBS domain-containing protein [Longimicrobium sp.]HSU16449.1 CBS domain-containing protein [Longimicrobium sp.]